MNRRLRLVCAATLACSVVLTAPLSPAHTSDNTLSFGNLAAAYAQDEINFETVKEKGVCSSFEKFDIYTMITEQDKITKKNQIVIYGELKMPYTYSDIEIDDHDYNYIQINQYMKGFFELDADHISGSKWDASIFKASIQPFAVDSSAESLTISLDNENFEVKLPRELAVLYTKDLEDALEEHGSEYRNALAFGMRITAESDKAFQNVAAEAAALLEKAQQPDTAVTQDEINDMRTKYNEAFARLQPEPFKREALQKSLELARLADAKQGRNNKRYEEEGYKAFSKLYQRAFELMEHKDLTSIVGSREGGNLPTHSEYESLPPALDEARKALKLVDYTPVDLSKLKELYNNAVALKPAEHKGYTQASFEALYSALYDSLYLMIDPYAHEAEVSEMSTRLERTIAGIVEEDLDASSAFDLRIRYRHPLDDAPSAKIDDYFRENDEIIVSTIPSVLAGQIVRIYLDDTALIKKFEGYDASSFFYASNDTSQDTVRVLRDETGRQFIVFRAEQNGGLDVKYLKHNPALDPIETEGTAQGGDSNAAIAARVIAAASSESAQQAVSDQTKRTRLASAQLPKTAEQANWGFAFAGSGLFVIILAGVQVASRRKY